VFTCATADVPTAVPVFRLRIEIFSIPDTIAAGTAKPAVPVLTIDKESVPAPPTNTSLALSVRCVALKAS